MLRCFYTITAFTLILLGIMAAPVVASGAVKHVYGGYVPVVAQLTPTGRLPETNQLRLAIGLPLRDRAGLEAFVAQVSDPASPDYRHYLTPEELTARFGPTEQDYQAVKDFALTNGLVVTSTFGNRLLLDVTGPVTAVEKAFNVTLRTYPHPTEVREFFAPDTAPTVDAALPLVDVGGLNNFSRPHSHRAKRHVQHGTPHNGTSPDGNGAIFGNDFRNAYVPGTTLTGAGQSVGLFEWDGSYSNAVAAYAKAAGGGRTNITIQYIYLDGYNGKPTTGSNSGEPEVDMDIEMAMAIAPGLSKIVVFEDDPNTTSPMNLLNTMAASNTVKNLSCSWGWASTDEPYTNTDDVFLEMAAQGQSFFNASGDADAFTIGATSTNGVDNPSVADAPSSSPFVIVVGGTVLTMNGTGASYASETVWNDGLLAGSYSGSDGGVSSYYPIPSWQTNISMTANKGSTTQRNIPDVALDAENIYEVLGKNATGDDDGGGTSSAAPLWAGFTALVNQQAAANGLPSAGFINPAIYAIGRSTNYSACFYDTTNGNNEWPSSPTQYVAVTGYDLCTGWGSPKAGLINALAVVPVAVDLLKPQTSGTNFQFQFLSQSGFTNAVQYRTNLVAGSWQLYTNVMGDGTTKTISIPLSVFSTSRQGFIQVLTQ